MPAAVLIVDDERHTREGLMLALEDDFEVYLAADAAEAFRLMESVALDAVITDLRMAGANGMKVIDRALQLPHQPVVFMMTAYGNVATAVEAMKRGATDFLTKPLNIEKLEILLRRALKGKQTEAKVQQLEERLDKHFSLEGIIGSSESLQHVLEQVKLVAPTRSTVLITGETGTGKELFAQAIHQNSGRARAPFVAVHAAALSSNLLESELFGHEKGAFTGATERRVGRFEAADGGTLFLDEIGEIDASTQVKLLRFLETRSLERLGSVKPIAVDVRLLAATHRDLNALVAQGQFREDLLYRLNVVTLRLPALRERTDDIPKLLQHFIAQIAAENGVEPVALEPSAVRRLQAYPWPGNIRELRNFAENAVVLHRGGRLSEYDLDPKFYDTAPAEVPRHGGRSPQAASVAERAPHEVPAPVASALSMEENEKRLLRNALLRSGGNRTRAAELLGVSRRTLHRKLRQWPDLDVRS